MKRIGEAMLEKTSLTTIPGALMAMLGGYLAMQGYVG